MLCLPTVGVTGFDIVWRMSLCGVGFGMFQTPNNIIMVIATPVQRTGGAGGMQSTARLVGQTLGATAVTLIFAILPQNMSVSTCLYAALGTSLLAGILSAIRAGRLQSEHP